VLHDRGLFSFHEQDFYCGKRVLELGCGIGVPGLSAALLGAKEVVLTDMVKKLMIHVNDISRGPLSWRMNTKVPLGGSTTMDQRQYPTE
jgi:2-polyprenyl-3-methyl-5-hydroxy-6-metoxy-1,4-benzoquinol methylase